MAGLSTRFTSAGYNEPKYKLNAHDKTLFYWSLYSLKHFFSPSNHFYFIALATHSSKHFIHQECNQLGIESYHVIEIKSPTDGQATTALIPLENLSHDPSPILIYNIDTYVDSTIISPENFTADGWIPTFNGKGDKWSFVKLNDNSNKAIQVAEKKRISPYASIGLYGFSSPHLYIECYKKHFHPSKNNEIKEKYIAPMYNNLIDEAYNITINNIPEESVYPLGTPEDLNQFLALIHFRK